MTLTPTPIQSAFIKLDQMLKFAGAVGTGGEAKDLIMDGKVRVNGEVCTQRGRKLYPGDVIAVPGASYQVVNAGEG